MPLIRKTPDAPAEVRPSSPEPDLHSPSADARWSAARSLATPEGVVALGDALAIETEPRVREAILTSLTRVASPRSAQVVALCIRSDDAALRTAALDALRAMPQAATAVLPDLLADADPDVRLLACEIVRELPGAQAGPLLIGLLQGEAEANVCASAIEVLAEVGGQEALPVLALCAERFAHEPFLTFSIKVARERIGAKPAGPLD